MDNLVEKINANLAKMDLPVNRKDAARAETVKWLLQNLSTRNGNHINFKQTKELLVKRATELNILKAKVLKTLNESLIT